MLWYWKVNLDGTMELATEYDVTGEGWHGPYASDDEAYEAGYDSWVAVGTTITDDETGR